MEKMYTVGELRKLVTESSQEFKAKLGDNVESENKKNNDKAYKDAEKVETNHYGKKMEAPKIAKYEKKDANRTMRDLKVDFEPSKEYKEREASQAKGYTSKDEENNGIDKAGAEFDDRATKAIEKTAKQIQKNSNEFGHLGIWGHNMPKDMIGYPSIFEEHKNAKTVYFKKTSFLTEGHMISRIPDEFKNEGTIFKMKDKNENEYLVEWSDNRANIIGHKNPKGLDESVERMKKLMGYKSSEYFENSTSTERFNESNDAFINTLNNARKMND